MFLEKFKIKIKNPLFLIRYIIFSIIFYFVIFFINYAFISNKIVEYFQINNRYLSTLSQYSLSDPYQTAVEIASSVNNYESIILKKTFATEIWDSSKKTIKDFPLFSSNSFNIYNERSKEKIISSLNRGLKNFLLYSNNQMYAVVIVHLHSPNFTQTKSKYYKIVLYKKLFDFEFLYRYEYLQYNFLNTSFMLLLILFFSSLFVFCMPQIFFDIHKEKNIEKKVTNNIKNLIGHALINQKNVLSAQNNIEERIQRALLYNHEAQKSLDAFYCDDLNPIEIIQEVWDQVYNPNHVNLICDIDMEKKIYFDKNEFFTTVSNIISNALHPSIMAKNLTIKIKNIIYLNRTLIEIINDGIPIKKGDKKRIFSGSTTKIDGHGIALKNIKEIFLKSGNDIQITYLNKQTCFRMKFKNSDVDFKIREIIHIQKKNLAVKPHQKPQADQNLPFVAIIEDENLIWDTWKIKMPDANIIFFESPDDFFTHIQMEKYDDRPFLSKIDMIICDYDFGNKYTLSNCHFFESLDKEEDEKFKGKFVLCSGFGKSIINEIPARILNRIDMIYPKDPTLYQEILKQINSKTL